MAIPELLRTEGVMGFTKGIAPGMLRDVPGTGMYFLTYSYLKNLIGVSERDHCGSWSQFFSLMIAGGFAGQVSWLVAYPFDVIKTRV